MTNERPSAQWDARWDDLPPDLRSLDRALDEAGAAWRAQSPAMAGVSEHLTASAQALTRPYLETARETAQPARAELPPREASDAVPSWLRERPRQQPARRWRLGGAFALMVALALAASFGAVFATAGRTPARQTTSAKHATPTPTASDRGRWIDLSQLDYSTDFAANGVPAIAPSDPNVVYETMARGLQQHLPASLRRTDDQGKTWVALPLPVPAAHVGSAGMAVSPLDAKTVYLTIIDTTAADCPANRLQSSGPGTGNFSLCWLQYTSTDGGMHWSPTQLPLADGIPGILNVVFPAQGSRLYASYSCVGPQVVACSRLVTSTDGGITWQFADQSLRAATSDRLYDAMSTPSGATVFAVTGPQSNGPPGQVPLTLWRSDDAGAHWASLGRLATPNELGMLAANDPNGNTLLYLALPRTTASIPNGAGGATPVWSSSPADVRVSQDGGQTWQHAPLAGIPTGYKLNFVYGPPSLLGPLPDGSVVAVVIPGSVQDNVAGDNPLGATLYAWRPGETAWHALGPKVVGEISAMLVVPSPSGGLTIYLTLTDRSDQGTFWFLREQI